MRAALYARYSNDRQNERSIEDQFAVCRRYAEARGWTIVATFSDAAISGSAMANRPGLQTLLEFDNMVAAGFTPGEADQLRRDAMTPQDEADARLIALIKEHGKWAEPAGGAA